jgi:hypothetical protein
MNLEQPPQLQEEKIVTTKTPEQQSNSQENASELLFARLSNPIIKKQVIDLLYEAEFWAGENVIYDVPVGKDENGAYKRDTDGKMLFNKEPHVPKTRDEIEKDYDKTLARVMSFTEMGFGPEQAYGGSVDSNEKVFLGWKWPRTGKPPTTQQWAIIEAHEKGHSMRPYSQYNNKFFKSYFSKAFDLSAIDFTDEDFQEYLRQNKLEEIKFADDDTPPTIESQRGEFFRYLFSGEEITERMSQLKNYFGFKSDEEFTFEHLRYAKEHYVADTGFNNKMTQFLKAITPETENEFIRLINSIGI